MSWVEELASGRLSALPKNGQEAQAVAAPPGVAARVAPARVCFARAKSFANEGAQFNTAEPICGLPQRYTDRVTFEQECVTCEKCKAALGQGPSTEADVLPSVAASRSAVSEVSVASEAPTRPTGSMKGALEVLLDTPWLEGRIRELEGELAAVRVLLEAARARDRVMSELGPPA